MATFIQVLLYCPRTESVMRPLISTLEDHVIRDAVWRRVSQALFSHIPSAGLEGVLEMVVQTTTP